MASKDYRAQVIFPSRIARLAKIQGVTRGFRSFADYLRHLVYADLRAHGAIKDGDEPPAGSS